MGGSIKTVYKFLFTAAGLLASAAAGVVAFVIFNLAPAVMWGKEVLIVSPYFTGLPGLAIGAAAFAISSKKLTRWLRLHQSTLTWTPSALQKIFVATSIFISVFLTYVASNGWYPQYFDVEWQEQIQLDDGSLEAIKRKLSFERSGFRLQKFKGASIRFHELRFTPGLGQPVVTIRTKFEPIYLNSIDGVWYLVLTGQEDGFHRTQLVEEWGKNYNTMGQRLAMLSGQRFVPVAWDQAPDVIVVNNLISRETFDIESFGTAANHSVTLSNKQVLMKEYLANPWAADPLRITRSQAMQKPMISEYHEALKPFRSTQ